MIEPLLWWIHPVVTSLSAAAANSGFFISDYAWLWPTNVLAQTTFTTKCAFYPKYCSSWCSLPWITCSINLQRFDEWAQDCYIAPYFLRLIDKVVQNQSWFVHAPSEEQFHSCIYKVWSSVRIAVCCRGCMEARLQGYWRWGHGAPGAGHQNFGFRCQGVRLCRLHISKTWVCFDIIEPS